MTRNSLFLLICLLCVTLTGSAIDRPAKIFTPIRDIIKDPHRFNDTFVSIIAHYNGWKGGPGSPPVTRSDWVAIDNGAAIYCTGAAPQDLLPGDTSSQKPKITILGKVKLTFSGKPYIDVTEVLPIRPKIEKMVSVAQILFDPFAMRGRFVGLHGVLAKGFDYRGMRFYLLADPSGTIPLGRLPKLYPTGTILRIRGLVGSDANGLPRIDKIEIISAKP